MTARAAILPPPSEADAGLLFAYRSAIAEMGDPDDRATDPDIPPSGCRETLSPCAPIDDAARANDCGAWYELPCGRTAETDCRECAPSLYVGGHRIEEP